MVSSNYPKVFTHPNFKPAEFADTWAKQDEWLTTKCPNGIDTCARGLAKRHNRWLKERREFQGIDLGRFDWPRFEAALVELQKALTTTLPGRNRFDKYTEDRESSGEEW